MAQTTNGITMRATKVEISTDGAAWTVISGHAASILVAGGERQIGEVFTADGDSPIVLPGKRSSYELTAKCVYTEVGGEPFAVVFAAYEAGTPIYIRWSPKGGNSTNYLYTSSAGIISSSPYPQGEFGSPDPVTFEFKIKCTSITRTTIV